MRNVETDSGRELLLLVAIKELYGDMGFASGLGRFNSMVAINNC